MIPKLRSRTIVAFISNRRALLVAAAVFHIVVTLGVFSAGRMGLFPQQIDSAGIGQFAPDSRDFLTQTDSLANTLLYDGVVAWLQHRAALHVKLHSLSFVAMRPLLGSSILTAEPVNLFCYLAILILTYRLAHRIAGERAALVSSAIVAVWPTLLLHTTQFLRDPLFIAAMLALVLVLTSLLTRPYTWVAGLAIGGAGAFAALLVFMNRTDFWIVIRAISFFAVVLFAVQVLLRKKASVGNVLGIIVVLMATNFILPLPVVTQRQAGASVNREIRDAGRPVWTRVAARRRKFIEQGYQSGSMIDGGVMFSGPSDIVKYIPRALIIGFFAPFPTMWFTSGYNVGIIGRVIAGFETTLTYVIELLACVFFWRNRRRLDVWLLVLTVTVAILALGLVVANVGTLYRIRYAFWILMLIMAVPVFTAWADSKRSSQTQGEPEPTGFH